MQTENPLSLPGTQHHADVHIIPTQPSRLSQLLARIPRPGVVAMVLAALLFSANTALAKLLSSNRSYSAFQNLYVRGCVTCVGSSIALLLAKRLPIPAIPGRVDLTLWALGRGILGTWAIGALYFGVASLPLTESVVLFGLNPVFAMLFSKVFLDEPLTWLRVAALPLFLAGIVVSANPVQYASGGSGGSTDVEDYALWLRRVVLVVGAACSGAAIVFARKMNSVEPLHWAAQGWWQGTVAALSAPMLSFVFSFRIIDDPIDVLLMLGMGLCALGGQLCVGLAIQHEHAAIIGVLWNFDMVFALAWQASIFAKAPRWYDLAGVACVFAASVVCVVEKTVLEWWHRRQENCAGNGGEGNETQQARQGGDNDQVQLVELRDQAEDNMPPTGGGIDDNSGHSSAEAAATERVPLLFPSSHGKHAVEMALAPSSTLLMGIDDDATTMVEQWDGAMVDDATMRGAGVTLAVGTTATATKPSLVFDAAPSRSVLLEDTKETFMPNGSGVVALLTRTFDAVMVDHRMASTAEVHEEDAAWCDSLHLSSKSTSLHRTSSSPIHPPIYVSSAGMPITSVRCRDVDEAVVACNPIGSSNASCTSSPTASVGEGAQCLERGTPPPLVEGVPCRAAYGNPLSPLTANSREGDAAHQPHRPPTSAQQQQQQDASSSCRSMQQVSVRLSPPSTAG